MTGIGDHDFGLVMPFWIDTPGYSDRDREMFVCGVEFHLLLEEIKSGFLGKRPIPIHSENSGRVRMMCQKLGLHAVLTDCGVEGWVNLEVTT